MIIYNNNRYRPCVSLERTQKYANFLQSTRSNIALETLINIFIVHKHLPYRNTTLCHIFTSKIWNKMFNKILLSVN